MGCKGSFTNGDGLCEQENHCGRYVPAAADRAIDIEFNEYPLSEIRSQSNINYQMVLQLCTLVWVSVSKLAVDSQIVVQPVEKYTRT